VGVRLTYSLTPITGASRIFFHTTCRTTYYRRSAKSSCARIQVTTSSKPSISGSIESRMSQSRFGMRFVVQIANGLLTAAHKSTRTCGHNFLNAPAHQYPVVYLVITHQHSNFVAHTTPRNLPTVKACRNRAIILCRFFGHAALIQTSLGMKDPKDFQQLLCTMERAWKTRMFWSLPNESVILSQEMRRVGLVHFRDRNSKLKRATVRKYLDMQRAIGNYGSRG